MQSILGDQSEQRIGWGLADVGDTSTLSLAEQNSQLDREVRTALANKTERLASLDLPASDSYSLAVLQAIIHEKIAALYDCGDVPLVVSRPTAAGKKAAGNSDLAVNIMPLVKQMNAEASVPDIASAIAASIKTSPYVSAVSTVGPFVNIEIAVDQFSPEVFAQVSELGAHYGWYRDGEPEVVVVDYSSPNIAKNLTVAHLRSTIIGQALINLEEAAGNVPFGVNHIGDWGTHFGNIIYQYERELEERGDEFLSELERNPAKTLMAIYRKFNQQVKDAVDEEARQRMLDAGRETFLRLERGDPAYSALWRQFRQWSLDDFTPIYGRLGVSFDAIQGEGFYEDRMPAAIQEAIDAGVLIRRDDGSVVFPSQQLIDPATMNTNDQIMTTQDGGPRDEIIVKPSGGTVYMTRDIAAILYRTRELGARRVLYVIGKEQASHCVELFNIAHQMGAVALGDAMHVSFGHLNLGGRKMSTRSGRVTLLGETLDAARDAAEQLVDVQRIGDFEAKKTLAEQLGVGAAIFNDLGQDRMKDIQFDPENDVPEMLRSGGGIYIQRTFASIGGILQRAEEAINQMDFSADNIGEHAAQKIEKDILMAIARFPEVVKDAASTSLPHKVATYLTELCQMLNSFQVDPAVPVVDESAPPATLFRAQLVAAASQVVENASKLLQLPLPAKM